jgi:hypothetical protein
MMIWRPKMIPFESRWELLEPGRGFQRVDEEHPLDFYLGLDVSGERVLLLVTDDDADIPTPTQAIEVFCRHRQDGRWALMFRLVRPELGRIFSHLCEDLVEFGRNMSKESRPAKAVIKRFSRWQRLLERGHDGLLDESGIRGLIGELLYLSHFALPAYGQVPALEGWVGPLDAEQDFRYPGSVVEVKSLRPSTSRVKISSAEQLEDPGCPLQLVTLTLNPSQRGDNDSFCLPDIIAGLRNRFEDDPLASSLFEERLLSAGYMEHEAYQGYVYQAGGFRHFSVREGFPRIVRSGLPAGIGSVVYELDLGACQMYEIDD